MKGGKKMDKTTVCFDYSNLIGRMAKLGVTRQELAPNIGLNPAYFGYILSAGKPISSEKIFRSKQLLEIPDDEIGLYFFTLKV